MASLTVGKWEEFYKGKESFPYGSPDSYKLGALFLQDCLTVEDRGCGAKWFSQIMKEVNPQTVVRGVDGSQGFCDVKADLATYKPKKSPTGIFMRHVLEHNENWEEILDNTLRGFKDKLFLVIYSPIGKGSHLLHLCFNDIPVYQLDEQTLLDKLATFHFERIEIIPSGEDSLETIFQITRV